jgi:prolyl-tRNA synthetase
MRMSKMLAGTLRDNPAEAEVVSYQLLVRAGYIRRLANGVYSYLPLMTRVLQKVEAIVREEMDRTGAQELLMPILQPAELWQASGRWDLYGPLMVRVKDRHDREYGLAPTAEEVITHIAQQEVRSYRQLPLNLYQIQTKYRDEIRPRFGLLRGREFIMKDAYSFHTSAEDLAREYEVMAGAYTRIFDRCGLETRQIQSDSGTIGGSVSHEYMVLTRTAEGQQESGENDVFYCEKCDYAANAERADSILPHAVTDGRDALSHYGENEEVKTPGTDTIDKLCRNLGEEGHPIPSSLICKALFYIKDEKEPFLILIRGDLQAEETKVLNAVDAQEIRLANEEEIAKYFGTKKGFVGIGEKGWLERHSPPRSSENTLECLPLRVNVGNIEIPFLVDISVTNLKNLIIAYNQTGFHKVNYNYLAFNKIVGLTTPRFKDSGFPETGVFDLKRARIGDLCPECEDGKLNMTRGIEVGNIFQLGKKYSERMKATYTAEDGSEQPFEMGCYGIGVSRTAAAAIERFHDKNGIIWPMAIAPYQVVVVPVNTQDETQRELGERLYAQLQAAGVEAMLDDRDERAGVKFKDADLLGIPIRVTAGKKAAEGLLEVKLRDSEQPIDLPEADVLAFVQKQIREWKPTLAPQEHAQKQGAKV